MTGTITSPPPGLDEARAGLAGDTPAPGIKGVDPLDARGIRLQRISVLTLVIAPFIGLVLAVSMLWGRALGWSDVLAFVVAYAIAGFGITVGYHRLLTHKSFDTPRWVRVAFAIAGSTAVEGPVIEWVADHRRHHAYSDHEGDPHSPHLVDGAGPVAALKGLWHAHMGWLFKTERTSHGRWARDLHDDRAMRFVHNAFFLWVVLGLLLPAAIGGIATGEWVGAFTALLWGGAVRVLVLNHITFSINSICHFYGFRSYETTDHSTNNWLLALPSMGESWHNNHHAFPSSARHGLGRLQVDLSAELIRVMSWVGLARNVRLPRPEVLQRRRIGNG